MHTGRVEPSARRPRRIVAYAWQPRPRLEVDLVRVQAVPVDHQLAQRRRLQLALQVADKRQVLLVAQQDECARPAERIGVRVKQARAWYRLQISTRGIPGVGRVDRRLILDQAIKHSVAWQGWSCDLRMQTNTIP